MGGGITAGYQPVSYTHLRFLNKELTDRHLEQLFSSGSTRLIKGFKGKKGCSFDAALTFDDSLDVYKRQVL